MSFSHFEALAADLALIINEENRTRLKLHQCRLMLQTEESLDWSPKGAPLAARIHSMLGPIQRFVMLLTVWACRHTNTQRSHFVNAVYSHVQLAPEVPSCNRSALLSCAPARPPTHLTPTPQTCCTDMKTFLLLLLLSLSGWGNVYRYLFFLSVLKHLMFFCLFPFLSFFPPITWLVEETIKKRKTYVYQCYNIKVTFCQIPFQMKAFCFYLELCCVKKNKLTK